MVSSICSQYLVSGGIWGFPAEKHADALLAAAVAMRMTHSLEAISKMHLTPDGGVAALSKCSHTTVVAALSNRAAPCPRA